MKPIEQMPTMVAQYLTLNLLNGDRVVPPCLQQEWHMINVQEKISRTFSDLATLAQQGHSMLDALAAVFAGRLLPAAYGPEDLSSYTKF